MTDRELLELAAKAAGIKVPAESAWGGVSAERGVYSMNCDGTRFEFQWNPLAADGDALRLAVKLDIDLRFDEIEQVVEVRRQATSYGEHEEYGADKGAVTRRAIVRAAAEIGRSSSGQVGAA